LSAILISTYQHFIESLIDISVKSHLVSDSYASSSFWLGSTIVNILSELIITTSSSDTPDSQGVSSPL